MQKLTSYLAAMAIRTMGRLADHTPIKASPPADAAVRLGLPWNFAWKSEARKARLLAARRTASVVAE
ncbi:hypothetical protein [Henriciella marina]|uniref:hypothetical protein n=1 Tax=Henriciella marina TaxID=453851 RepID=UPI00035F9498|nr:hypothetical protein [Henriciella marina]